MKKAQVVVLSARLSQKKSYCFEINPIDLEQANLKYEKSYSEFNLEAV